MTWYQILALVGVPSIVTAVLNWIERRAIRRETLKIKSEDKTDALALGVQALLRAQMITDYNKSIDKGYAPIYVRENFENVYNQYKNLGGNGVMTDIHEKFRALPTKPPKGEES